MKPSGNPGSTCSKRDKLRFPVFLPFLILTMVSCGGGGGPNVPSPPAVTTTAAQNVIVGSATLSGTLNPNGLDTYARFEWGTDNTLDGADNTVVQVFAAGTTIRPVFALIDNLAVDTLYYFRLAAWNSAGENKGEIQNFSIAPIAPTVTTSDASNFTIDSATLNGQVNPNGLATQAWFEWGEDPDLVDPTRTDEQGVGEGTASQSVSAPLSGLAVGTPYFFRLAAWNSAGENRGEIQSFSITPIAPTVVTSPATGLSATAATLNGQVNPNGLATDAWFEWGTDDTLIVFTETERRGVGSGTASQAFDELLSGLDGDVTYYFRLAAVNSAGESRGDIEPFMTPLLPTVTTSPATNITTGGATLRGTVSTSSGAASEAWFRYGTSPTLSSFAETSRQQIGPGATNQEVNIGVTGLAAWRTHYFRIVAANLSDPDDLSLGEILSFPTGEYYVAVGDSITWGGGEGYEPILEDLLTAAKGYPHRVANEGVSGDTSADGAFWIGDTLEAHPSAKYYLILYGTNDADIPAVSTESYRNNIQTIISAILAAGKTPYLAKVPYTSDPLIDLGAIQAYNVVIDELVFTNGIPVIPPDFYTHFESNPDELQADGVHPNDSGYESMANLWFDALTTP
jgi:lysophospholipase L1-like esterase